MSPYDSDSSDGGEDYTETSTLLGYVSKEATGDAISHLGGVPTWLDDKTAPSGTLAKCKVCNDLLTVLLELNGDLPDRFPCHERRLYIWSCRRKTCRRKEGSVRGIRGVRVAKGAGGKAVAKADKAEKVEANKDEKPQLGIGEALFGVKSVKNDSSGAAPSNPITNPFSSNAKGKAPPNPFSSAGANPFAAATPTVQVTSDEPKEEGTATLAETFADKVRLSSPPPPSQPPRPHEPWPTQSSFPPPYPHYHLDAEYETLDAPSTPQIPVNARVDMDLDAEGSGGTGKEDKEVFESTLDKTFQKFADRVGQNPEQVLRYEFQGRPLLYSDNDKVGKTLAPHAENGSFSHAKVTIASSKGGVGLPRCQNCGADRAFEVQLTPHAITELEADEMGIDGMEWGTIILGVCSKDCKPNDVPEGEVGYLEEWVGVQWEEVAAKK
ncbi:programmed cell death protein 2 [Massariosphaeria phaeospora]|uniref:Programmed cell death protein 2 n=1 Tax=Massariosphaeria phaeospora TaxID=100035 RepID=A0A7C8M8T2_9PLEO|nr:programmed cell death protein 2 [Massariosphaeria phaeospora]